VSRSYSSEGIVLTSKSYGEADRILVLYTKDHGRTSLIAKGVRRLKSRKRRHLEVFSHVKFQAAHGKSLDIITEAEIINSFHELRKNLKKVSVAYYFMEVIGRTTRDGERNNQLYEHLLRNLRRLQKTKKLKELRRNYAIKSLEILGFWPRNKKINDPDQLIEELLERKLSSIRVGKKLQK